MTARLAWRWCRRWVRSPVSGGRGRQLRRVWSLRSYSSMLFGPVDEAKECRWSLHLTTKKGGTSLSILKLSITCTCTLSLTFHVIIFVIRNMLKRCAQNFQPNVANCASLLFWQCYQNCLLLLFDTDTVKKELTKKNS